VAVLRETGGDAASAMDAIYRTQRHIYDATRKYFLLGRDRMLEGLAPPQGGSILEVGCGTGRNLIRAARLHTSARLFGFDISPAMLETAAGSIARSGLAGRVRIAQGDATQFSAEQLFGQGKFDRVFISYALSMIPPWREALGQSFRAVALGGSLHIVDFGEQSGLPGWFGKGLRAWLAKFSVEPRQGLEAELTRLADITGARLALERPYRDYARLAVITKP
jgi:S-adenosylmethionine-diacylgycerolhomoserine-N-methlytransferase